MEGQKQEATLIVERSFSEDASETASSILHKLIMDALNRAQSEKETANK